MLKVLLVSQDSESRNEMIRAFDSYLPQVKVFCSNYLETLSMVNKESPNVVILDTNINGKTRDEIIQRLSTRRDTCVLALLSHQDGPEVANILEMGADDCVVKQITQMELITHVKTLLRRSHKVGNEIQDGK